MGKVTRGTLLATLKELKKHKRPKVANPVSASVQAIVPVNNPQPKKSKELARAIAERRAILLGGGFLYGLSEVDRLLLQRITTPHYDSSVLTGNLPKEPFGEMWIHWFYLPRSEDALTKCEVFHLNMLMAFAIPQRVRKIHIRCAYKGGNLTGAMQQVISVLSRGKAEIDFSVHLPKSSWEHDTIKECAEYAVATGEYVYYTHFKGVSHLATGVAGCYPPNPNKRILALNELYWCFLMYWGLFISFPVGTPVIGPLRYNGICKTFSNKDTGWSKGPGCHCAGSYQAFSGRLLAEEFDKMGMDKEGRNRLLWDGDTHIVEMLLTAVFPLEQISSIGMFNGSAYSAYSAKRCFNKEYQAFSNLYVE